ncbi:S8 family serine peptidase [Micromonosporaceae bacterium B7E4]
MTLFGAGPPDVARAAAPSPADQPRLDVIDPHLRTTMAAMAAGEQVEYLLQVAATPDLTRTGTGRAAVVAALRKTAEESQRPILEQLRKQGSEVLNTYWLANLILVRSPKETVTALTANRSVSRVYQVETLHVPEPEPEREPAPAPESDSAGDVGVNTVEDRTWGIDKIGAHRVWDELGIDGTGVRVAVLDTGVNLRHPDLAGKMATDDPADPTYPGGWMEWDAVGNPISGTPRDSQSHGTHVSGTVVGGNASGVHIGVAPGAQLMHGLVLPGGSGTTPQILAGMQWAVDPYDADGNRAGRPADVVNMSFGAASGGFNQLFVEPVRNMYAAGVLPVAAAGNCGPGCHSSPANVYEALAVGATDVADNVAAFSGGGTATLADWSNPPASWPARWVVPDLAAPGVNVLSSVPASFGSPYGRNNGTSMASPHVAGTAALMISANPDLGPAEIGDALLATAYFDDPQGAQRPNDRIGQGRLDAFQATSLVALGSGVGGTVVDGGTGEPVADVRVEVAGADISLRTIADGRFDFRLPPGTYTLELFWAGRLVSTVSDVVVGATVTSVDVPLSGIAGQVTDGAGGAPLPGVHIDAAGTGVSATTSGDGAYRLYLSPGEYALHLSTFGYAERTASGVEVVAERVTTVDRELSRLPTGTVTGTVSYSASGYGVPGVPVTLVDGPRSAVTDGAGRYTIEDVPIGGHQVVARPQVFREPTPRSVTAVADATATVDFPLDCAAQCSGLWNARYSGPVATGMDTADATVTSPDGSRLYVAGGSTGEGTNIDFVTVAYEPATGRQLWEARYNGPSSSQDSVNDVAVSPDGSRLFVTGLSVGRGNSSSGADYATVAYDAATGAQLWVARYNGPADNFDNARAVDVSPDGSRVFITGQSQAVDTKTHSEYATVAYDAATGAQLWVTRYNGPSSDFDSAVALVANPAGGAVYVTGQSPGEGGQSSSKGSGWDYATVAYDDTTGAQLWVARYDGPATALDQPTGLAITPDGDRLFVTGAATGVSGTADYGTVAYVTADGTQVWAALHDGPSHAVDQAKAVTVSDDGAAVYVTGVSESDYATVAYRAGDGATVWAARYAGPAGGVDRGLSIAASPDGAQVVVTGESAGDGTGFDFATVGYASGTGAERWAARYDGPPSDDDNASAVTVSPDSTRVYVTGGSDLGIGDDPAVAPSDYVTLAYDADGSAKSPVFIAHDLRVLPGVTSPGAPVEVVGEVTNVGTGSGEYAATLVVDGVQAATTRVALGPGGHTTVRWPVSRAESGSHQMRFGATSGELRVVACDRTVRGRHAGKLTVSDGVTCLAAGAKVSGPVTVRPGAGLLATGATVTGKVSANGATVVALYDTVVTGAVTVTGSTGAVSVVASRTGPVRLSGNTTGGFPIVVAGNDIRGPLACDGNTPSPNNHREPNSVTGMAAGQCVGL